MGSSCSGHPSRQSVVGILMGCFWLVFLVSSIAAQTETGAAAGPPGQIVDPREVLQRYPPFSAEPRIPALEESGYYPCSDCHDGDYQISNPRVRVLEDMHEDIELQHGGGRFWCLTCHHEEDRDSLASLKGQPISFDEAFLLCGQCHFQRQRDFFYGAHGKRLGSWQGTRTVVSCTQCHDAHRPAILSREPYDPPEVRRGLTRSPGKEEHRPDRWSEPTPSDTDTSEASTEPEEPDR